MVVVLPRPLQVAHAEPVQKHGELARRLGERLGERLAFERQRPSVAAKAHGQRQRIAGVGQVVADDAVERGERDLPPARDRPIVGLRADERRAGADPLAGQPERAADAAIDEPRDPAGEALGQRREPRRVEDGHVHLLDEPRHPRRALRGEPAEAEDVGQREGGGLGGHGRSLGVGRGKRRADWRLICGRLGKRPAAHSPTPARPATRARAIQPK